MTTASATAASDQDDVERTDVLVIGAGMAGRNGGTQPRHAGADDEHVRLFDVALIRCGGCGSGRHV